MNGGMIRKTITALAGAVLCLWGLPAWAEAPADPGEALLAERCASCHNLDAPRPRSPEALWSRKGPDLSYAGNKYRQEWVAEWLQKPGRIRPAGMFYGNHIKTTDKWDVVDTATLPTHPALGAADARLAAAALMKRKAKNALLEGVEVKPVTFSVIMGDMMFDKFKGCIACHQSGPDYGGFSGPELYTAAERLTPEYMYSYMRDPQAWDPGIWMPRMPLSDAELNKLVRYLQMIAEEEE